MYIVYIYVYSPVAVRLEGGSADGSSGRVVLTYRGTDGTICDDSWDNKDAKVVCKMLGYK